MIFEIIFVMDNIHNFIQIYIICRANAVPLSEQGKLLTLVTEVGAKLMNDVDRIEWLCEPFQINHTYSLWKWHEKNQNYAWILFRSIYIIASAFTVQTVSLKERSCLSYAIGFNSDELHIYFFYKLNYLVSYANKTKITKSMYEFKFVQYILLLMHSKYKFVS